MKQFQTLVEVLRSRAREAPDRDAYVFAAEGCAVGLTHASLEQQALAIAARLAQLCRPGCCVAFSIEIDGEEMLAVVAEAERRHLERRSGGTTASAGERREGADRRQLEPLPASIPQEQALDLREVKARIRQGVAAACGLSVAVIALVPAGSIPKTSSGKIQRRLTREMLQNGSLDVFSDDDARLSEEGARR